ncbi:UDP-N-acetylmuramoylalanine--D-glutamate ligase [Dirofilaria immitis]
MSPMNIFFSLIFAINSIAGNWSLQQYCQFICCVCQSICDPSRNVQVEGDTVSSSLLKNFQNIAPFKISSIESQIAGDVAQSTTDVEDNLVPMQFGNDEKINPEKLLVANGEVNHPLISKELKSLPAPVNDYAVDRIFQENNLKIPIPGQWTDEWDTITTLIPSVTLDFGRDYDDSRNLFDNEINAKSVDTLNVSPERADYSYNFPETQTTAHWSVIHDEKFKKPEQHDKENYYDEVEDERSDHIAFSPYSSMKKHQNIFMDIIPKRLCKLCGISDIQMTESPEQTDEMTSFVGKNNLKGANIMKSKSELHIADNTDNNTIKEVKKSNKSNLRINFLNTNENEKKPNLKSQLQRDYRVIGPFKKILFHPLNRNLVRTNSMTKNPKVTGQLNVSPFSLLKFRKELSDESTKFFVKSIKLAKGIKQEKPADSFLHYIRRPEIENTMDDFCNALTFEVRRDIWANIFSTSQKQSLGVKKKLSKALIPHQH